MKATDELNEFVPVESRLDADYEVYSALHRENRMLRWGAGLLACCFGLAGADRDTLRRKRDVAIISLLLGCGLRRSEVIALKADNIQRRYERWAITDLVGKAGHVRTVPVPGWVKAAIDAWTEAAGVVNGRLFRSIRKSRAVWGNGITQNVVWYVVKNCARRSGIKPLAPHDLRRTCARLCHAAGGELEQIQFLLGHASVQTTERYVGCQQDLSRAVNDRLPFASR